MHTVTWEEYAKHKPVRRCCQTALLPSSSERTVQSHGRARLAQVQAEMNALLPAMTKVLAEFAERGLDLPLRPYRLYRADVRQAHRDVAHWQRLMTKFAHRTLAQARASIAAEADAVSKPGMSAAVLDLRVAGEELDISSGWGGVHASLRTCSPARCHGAMNAWSHEHVPGRMLGPASPLQLSTT